MPKRKPNAQIVATEKYQKKMGYISKSYKLKKELVDNFAKACKKANISQTKKLSEFMQDLIDKIK